MKSHSVLAFYFCLALDLICTVVQAQGGGGMQKAAQNNAQCNAQYMQMLCNNFIMASGINQFADLNCDQDSPAGQAIQKGSDMLSMGMAKMVHGGATMMRNGLMEMMKLMPGGDQ